MIEHSKAPWIANGLDIVHRPTQFNGKPLCDLPIIGAAESRGAIPEDDHVADANAQLMAAALTAPHECSDPQCPGNENRRKLEAFDGLLAAMETFTDEVTAFHRTLGPHRCEDVRPVCPNIDAARAAIDKAKEITPPDARGTDSQESTGKGE